VLSVSMLHLQVFLQSLIATALSSIIIQLASVAYNLK